LDKRRIPMGRVIMLSDLEQVISDIKDELGKAGVDKLPLSSSQVELEIEVRHTTSLDGAMQQTINLRKRPRSIKWRLLDIDTPFIDVKLTIE